VLGDSRRAEESNDSGLPLPVTTYDRVPVEPGMTPATPVEASMAPLRDSHTSLPKWRSLVV
jgi:hypothetical protein